MQHTINKRNPNATYLAKAGWNFAKSLLWQHQDFNETEVELATKLIETYLQKSTHTMNKFIAFCERVQLANQYVQRNANRYLPHPLQWLSPHFEKGFYGTRNWYLDLIHQRSYIPIHRFELRVMAEAYLQFVLDATQENYLIGKKAIQHYNQSDVMQWYKNAILNFKYEN